MWITILELATPIILWGVKTFISSREKKDRMEKKWRQWIKAEEKKAKRSTRLRDSYEDQVDHFMDESNQVKRIKEDERKEKDQRAKQPE